MNFFGETSGPEHKFFGRIAPICEVIHRVLLKTSEPPVLSDKVPEWCHNIVDRLARTILKRLADLNPAGKFDARNYGRMVGLILRGAVYFCKEVPAELKRDGLLDLKPEEEKKVEGMIGMDALLSFASQKFNRPISNEDELLGAAGSELEKRMEIQGVGLMAVARYLLNRPVAEQHEFLCGIPEGFTLYIDNDGDFSGKRQRTELYLRLLLFWPEITEMQRSQPPKTCKFLLDWLEKIECGQLVSDDKQFYGLCGEIGLVMAPPGHPQTS